MVDPSNLFSAQPSGRGRPDNSRNISIGRRVETFPQYEPLPNETLKVYRYVATSNSSQSTFPGVNPPLSPGQTVQLFDLATGQPMPESIQAGQEWELLQPALNPINGSVRYDAVIDNNLAASTFQNTGQFTGSIRLSGATTAFVDPDFSDPHDVTYEITNIGNDPVQFNAVLIARIIDQTV